MDASGPDLVRLSDEDLMRLVADMDAAAFEVLYDRHSAAAYGLCRRIVRTPGLADDVLQEAFLSVWRSGGRYDRKLGSVRAWILSITHNRAIDALRRTRRHSERETHDETAAERQPAAETTDDEALRRVAAAATTSALDCLSADQRRVVELAFYSGYSHSEIADSLELPLGTVKGRMRLALERLQLELAGAV